VVNCTRPKNDAIAAGAIVRHAVVMDTISQLVLAATVLVVLIAYQSTPSPFPFQEDAGGGTKGELGGSCQGEGTLRSGR